MPASTAGETASSGGPGVGTPSPSRNWKDVVCPLGGAHEWEYVHRGNMSAGAVTGTAGVCSLLFCWPALFCLPLLYVGTSKGVKATSDRKCLRCGMVVTHDGRMKAQPTGVPRVNPATGVKNSEYGARRASSGKYMYVVGRSGRQRC